MQRRKKVPKSERKVFLAETFLAAWLSYYNRIIILRYFAKYSRANRGSVQRLVRQRGQVSRHTQHGRSAARDHVRRRPLPNLAAIDWGQWNHSEARVHSEDGNRRQRPDAGYENLQEENQWVTGAIDLDAFTSIIFCREILQEENCSGRVGGRAHHQNNQNQSLLAAAAAGNNHEPQLALKHS